MTTSTQLVITADDFGADLAINEAVELAHRRGSLSCASLMIGQGAAADAVVRAKALPSLGVGLHLTLVCGAPILPSQEVDLLCGSDGMLLENLPRAGTRWFFHPRARAQMRAEIEAQFAAFAATGLALDHVNAHNHMHIHPSVLPHVVRLAKAQNCRWIRLPFEPRGLPLVARPWLAWMRRYLMRANMRHNDTVVGLNSSGQVTQDVLLAALANLSSGISEIYLHPATHRNAHFARQMPDYDPVGEYDALCSDALKAGLAELRLTPKRFADLV
jgi:chitin disaccharide deacetylase